MLTEIVTNPHTCFAQVSTVNALLRDELTMSDSDKKDKYVSTNSIIFNGKKVEDWFKFDRQILRWVRKTYGVSGEKLWSETAIVIDRNSVDAIAQDTYEALIELEGFKN